MNDAHTHFGLLLADIWDRPAASMVIRQAAGTEQDLPLQLGADATGRRHILAPITEDYAFSPEKGRAIELTEWRHPGTGQRYLDLWCDQDDLVRPFCTLADHIIERVDLGGESPHIALQGALNEWRKLLRPARPLSEEAARGLFGELHVLGKLAGHNPLFAVERWTGPEGDLHDFRTPNGDIEVKTSTKEGQTVTVSGLDQLDRIGEVPLVMVRVQVKSSPTGQNIGDLVAELAALGCLQLSLVERLEAAGFRLGIDPDDHRYVVTRPLQAWRVDDDFPGLRSYDIPKARCGAISHIRYDLDLLGAPGEMTHDELDAYLLGMMSA